METKEIVKQLADTLKELTTKRQELSGEGNLDGEVYVKMVNAETKMANLLAKLQEQTPPQEQMQMSKKGPMLCPKHEEECMAGMLEIAYRKSFECPICVKIRNDAKPGKESSA